MKKSKNGTQESLITVVIMAASIIAFIGGYVLSSGLTTKTFYKIKYEKDEEIVSADTSLTDNLAFDENNLYDRDINLHYNVEFPKVVVDDSSYLTMKYGNNAYEVIIEKYVNNELVKDYKLEFDKQINDVLGHKGIDVTKDVIYYLLSDGSVEYTLIDDLISNDYLRTNGRLNEASNIVRFIKGNACDRNTNECDEVIFAQNKDGLLYNMDEMI